MVADTIGDSSSNQAFRDGSGTHFAPAGRDDPAEIQKKRRAAQSDTTLRAVLDSMPSWMLVLNQRRQVVRVNSALLKKVDAEEDELVGKRPGEIVGCVNAAEGPDGCGTSSLCSSCGAVLTLLESQQTGRTATGQCRLRTSGGAWGHALELRVNATPLEIGGETFLLVGLEDLSDRSRLAVLTRVFFHDAMNTVLGLENHLKALEGKAALGPIDPREIASLRRHLDSLADEIRGQRELMLAEAGDLRVAPEVVSTAELIERVADLHAPEAGAGPRIFLGEIWDGELTTDGPLLMRVLGNMVRNAVEATRPDRAVTLACRDLGQDVRFSVHNEEAIPEQIGRHIFQRSFSTKAAKGRGIGAHSMKLFGERYLRGRVDFESTPSGGTTFWIDLPKNYPGDTQ